VIRALVSNLGQQLPPLRRFAIGLGPFLFGLTPERGQLDAPRLDPGFSVG
jgi:hypothetical protein